MNTAYSVAVKIALVDGVTRGLQMLSRHFKTTDGDARALETRMKSIAKLAATGAAMSAAGGGMLAMLKGPIEEAQKYQTELTKIAALGFGSAVVDHADKFARSANIIGNSATQMAHAYGDALAVFKNANEADFAAPIMAKMHFANAALYGEAGGGRDAALQSMLKVIEYRGGTTSQAAFNAQAEMAEKINNASRGRVDGAQLLQAMKSGGILAKMMTNQAFYLDSEPLIQEMGGFRFGTGLNAIYGNLGQGRGSQLAQQELYRLGALDRSRVEFNSQGRLKRALPGAFMGMDALEQGGVQGLLTNYLLPLFARAGITAPKDIQNELGMVASNSRGAALLGAAYQQLQKIQMQAAANQKALGIDGTVGAAKGTYAGQLADFDAKLANFKLVLGRDGGVLDLATKGLGFFTGKLQTLNTLMERHKGLTKFAAEAFVTVGAMTTIAGGMALLGATVRGLGLAWAVAKLPLMFPILETAFWGIAAALTGLSLPVIGVIAAIAGLGAAMYALYRYWDKIKSFFGFGSGTVVPGGAVPPAPQKQFRFDLSTHLDGRKIAQSTTHHQAKAANGPNQGTSGPDWSRAYVPTSLAAR